MDDYPRTPRPIRSGFGAHNSTAQIKLPTDPRVNTESRGPKPRLFRYNASSRNNLRRPASLAPPSPPAKQRHAPNPPRRPHSRPHPPKSLLSLRDRLFRVNRRLAPLLRTQPPWLGSIARATVFETFVATSGASGAPTSAPSAGYSGPAAAHPRRTASRGKSSKKSCTRSPSRDRLNQVPSELHHRRHRSPHLS